MVNKKINVNLEHLILYKKRMKTLKELLGDIPYLTHHLENVGTNKLNRLFRLDLISALKVISMIIIGIEVVKLFSPKNEIFRDKIVRYDNQRRPKLPKADPADIERRSDEDVRRNAPKSIEDMRREGWIHTFISKQIFDRIAQRKAAEAENDAIMRQMSFLKYKEILHILKKYYDYLPEYIRILLEFLLGYLLFLAGIFGLFGILYAVYYLIISVKHFLLHGKSLKRKIRQKIKNLSFETYKSVYKMLFILSNSAKESSFMKSSLEWFINPLFSGLWIILDALNPFGSLDSIDLSTSIWGALTFLAIIGIYFYNKKDTKQTKEEEDQKQKSTWDVIVDIICHALIFSFFGKCLINCAFFALPFIKNMIFLIDRLLSIKTLYLFIFNLLNKYEKFFGGNTKELPPKIFEAKNNEINTCKNPLLDKNKPNVNTLKSVDINALFNDLFNLKITTARPLDNASIIAIYFYCFINNLNFLSYLLSIFYKDLKINKKPPFKTE